MDVLKKLKVVEIREQLKAAGLEITGLKSVLLERLFAYKSATTNQDDQCQEINSRMMNC